LWSVSLIGVSRVAAPAFGAGYESDDEEGIMVTNDYLFAVLFMICVWFLRHAGRGHSLRH